MFTVARCFVLLAAAVQSPASGQKPAEKARLEQVVEWVARAGPEGCSALTEVLVEESFDLRCRAASALYWKCDRAAAAGFADKLCRSLDLGNAEAGAVLLLGYAPPDIALPCLRRAARRSEMVKLTTSSRPVSIALPAQVALARLGDTEALGRLRRAFDKPAVAAALFLLGVLRDIEDPEALRQAVKLLDDGRRAPGVVAHATRAIRDVALEALVWRLSLAPSFAVEPGRRYAPREVDEVRRAAQQALSLSPGN